MSTSEATLTLVMRARNLAGTAVADLKTSLAGVGAAARNAGAELATAFAGKGRQIANELGNVVVNVLNGQDFSQAGLALGATMAGGVVAAFGEKLIAALAGTAVVQGLLATLSALGTAIGGFIAAAIPVGMALLPALLVAALVAAVAFLVTHPELAKKILDVAGSIVGGIISGLAKLPGLLLDVFVKAAGFVLSNTITLIGNIVTWYLSIPGKIIGLGIAIVTTIVNGLVSLPGKIADVIRTAFENLKIDVGPFHINGKTGITIDLPNIVDVQHQTGAGIESYGKGHSGGTGPGLVSGDTHIHTHLYLDGRQIAEVVDGIQAREFLRQPLRTG